MTDSRLPPKMPPPANPQNRARPTTWLWGSIEEAQRAWAITAAARFLAGREGLGTVSVVSAADQILGYVKGNA